MNMKRNENGNFSLIPFIFTLFIIIREEMIKCNITKVTVKQA